MLLGREGKEPPCCSGIASDQQLLVSKADSCSGRQRGSPHITSSTLSTNLRATHQQLLNAQPSHSPTTSHPELSVIVKTKQHKYLCAKASLQAQLLNPAHLSPAFMSMSSNKPSLGGHKLYPNA